MLFEFITLNRNEIITRCRAKVATRSIPPPSEAEINHGVPLFLDQLVEMLESGGTTLEMDRSAGQHGHDLLLKGFTVSQVVHDYGDVCQTITELALETNAPISTGDFQTLNRCLDEAIASAVTMYTRESQQSHSDKATDRDNERVGFLVHEMRNLVNTAVVAFEVLKSGNVAVGREHWGGTQSNPHGTARSHCRVARGHSFDECRQEQETDPRVRIHRRDWSGRRIGGRRPWPQADCCPRAGGISGGSRSTNPRSGGRESLAERVQVHAVAQCRDVTSPCQRRSRSHRGPGRMWGPSGRS